MFIYTATNLHRLEQVAVEAGVAAALAVLGLALAAERDGHGRGKPGVTAQRPRHGIALHARQPDVEQDHAGLQAACHIQRLHAVVGQLHPVAVGLQQQRQRLRLITVVVHHQDGRWLQQRAPLVPRLV